MKKSDPKIILNVSLDSPELEDKIKLAMDEYAEKLIEKNIDETIKKIVTKRVNALLSANKWSNDSKIDGVSFDEFVNKKAERAIVEIIDKNIKDIFAKKVAEML